MAPVSALPLDSPALLTVVLDLAPLSWADAASGSDGEEPLSLQTTLDHLLAFLNAHLAYSSANGLAVWGVLGSKSILLYASTDPVPGGNKPDPQIYEPFRLMNESIRSNIQALLAYSDDEAAAAPTSLVTALTKALCYINRLHHPPPQGGIAMGVSSTGASTRKTTAAVSTLGGASSRSADQEASHNARILVLSASEEESSGYVSLMNCIFSAQKARIVIDVCKLAGSDAIFLQQASHLTGGIYLRIPRRSALLQYLMMTFLPARPLRRIVLLPSQDRVDFRAACFCHKNIVDVGYVCSVCLSIFCKPVPVCSTCKTKFPLPTIKALQANMPRLPPSSTPGGSGNSSLAGVVAARSVARSAMPMTPNGMVGGSPLARE